MIQRIYHGEIHPNDFAHALIAKFNRGNLKVQQIGSDDQVVVQIATRAGATSGGDTAIAIVMKEVSDGVSVQIGKQAWLGVAASLGKTAFYALRNPLSLLNRLDDIAQDIENLQISEQAWEIIEQVAKAAGASFELSERLRQIACEYCNTANPINEPSCLACGAPLGQSQPNTCKKCGFVIQKGETTCPNCNSPIFV
jgi:DNA-directed RNA polymerase subunit RPC12/RpoP